VLPAIYALLARREERRDGAQAPTPAA
jgi:hypothetical protein